MARVAAPPMERNIAGWGSPYLGMIEVSATSLSRISNLALSHALIWKSQRPDDKGLATGEMVFNRVLAPPSTRRSSIGQVAAPAVSTDQRIGERSAFG